VDFADIWANNIRGSSASVKIPFQHDGILLMSLFMVDTDLCIS